MPALLRYTDTGPQLQPRSVKCKRDVMYVEVSIMSFNGRTARNQTKPSTPLHSPLDLSPQNKFLRSNGFSRRTRLSHEILPSAVAAAVTAAACVVESV